MQQVLKALLSDDMELLRRNVFCIYNIYHTRIHISFSLHIYRYTYDVWSGSLGFSEFWRAHAEYTEVGTIFEREPEFLDIPSIFKKLNLNVNFCLIHRYH